MSMQKTKKALLGFMAAVALCFGMMGVAEAAATDSEVHFSQSGNGVNVTLDGNGSDVSGFSLALDVDPDVTDAVQIGFEFSDDVKGATSIHKATYNTVGDKTRITLYVAGGHDLFAQSLNVGTITLGLDTAVSSGADVVVDVPEVDLTDEGDDEERGQVHALRTVTGSYIDNEAGVYVAEPFTAHLGDRATDDNPGDDGRPGNDSRPGGEGGNTTPTPGDTGSTNPPTMGPDDGYGPTDDPTRTGSNVGNQPNGGNLSSTGDALVPVVVTLLCVAALALCAMGFLILKRRKRS